MERTSQTLVRLELETAAYHRDADDAWLQLLTPFLTKARYGSQLARAYAFEAPVEAALAYTPHVTSLVGMRARSRLLAHDLFALDYPTGKLAPKLIAPFPSVSEALGWLYVVERTARLHEMVLRNVRHRLPGAPTEYLQDDDATARWDELGQVLDRVARTPRIADQVMYAAHDGFRCLLDWYVATADDQPLRRGA
jgi:heme oxygenase